MKLEINKDELLELIRQGNGLRKLAEHFNVSIYYIRKNIKQYWNGNISDFLIIR